MRGALVAGRRGALARVPRLRRALRRAGWSSSSTARLRRAGILRRRRPPSRQGIPEASARTVSPKRALLLRRIPCRHLTDHRYGRPRNCSAVRPCQFAVGLSLSAARRSLTSAESGVIGRDSEFLQSVQTSANELDAAPGGWPNARALQRHPTRIRESWLRRAVAALAAQAELLRYSDLLDRQDGAAHGPGSFAPGASRDRLAVLECRRGIRNITVIVRPSSWSTKTKPPANPASPSISVAASPTSACCSSS